MLWYFVVLLDFFFSIVKLGEPNITVSHTIFLCCLFVFFVFLMHNFKTSNNFSSKICYKNIVNVKNRIIISNWDLPQLEIKNIAKMLLHFVVFLGFFCVWYFVVLLLPRLLFLFSQIWWAKIHFFRHNFLQLAFYFIFLIHC